MKKIFFGKTVAKLLLLTFALSASNHAEAQFWKKKKKPATEKEKKEKSDFEPYEKVITKEAHSDSGLFTVHEVKGTHYFEIPDTLLGREMLIVSRRAAMSGSEKDKMVAGERASEGLMVRWEKTPDQKQILLRKITTKNLLQHKGKDAAFEKAVALQSLDPILLSFPIKTISKDSTSSVIDVADLFVSDVKELTPFAIKDIFVLLGFRAPDKYKFEKERSFITKTNSFEQNIEVRSMLTYTKIDKQGTNVFTILMHRSMILLPEKPMQPRLADERIGHFTQAFKEFNEDKPVDLNYYVKRWRLEPKEEDLEKFKNGELVEPKKKIVFYIDNTTPEIWRKYIKQGVADWQPAFEEAGFKNAIEAKDMPENDPEFHPEDVRYSVIRYVASDIPNAKGPSVIDPRSGEILESDVIMYHNVLKLLREWRFAQTAATDPEVRTTKIPDEVIGDALRYVVAHELGHALGLRHNMGASTAFPVDSLRSASFTQKYGTTPSIMDYARFNYVAQPGDKGVKLTPPNLGVYDKYAIKWAYKPILSAKDEYEEVATLNGWIEEHAGNPWYYFGEGDLVSTDPTSLRESLGDDIVKASEYGVENVKYTIRNLNNWLAEPGKKYNDMENLYMAVLGQYNRYLGHVGTMIGGTYFRRPVQGQDEVAYRYIPQEKQREAVQFMLTQFRELPEWLTNEPLDSKLNIVIENGVVRRIMAPSTYIEYIYERHFRGNLINDGKFWSLIDDEIEHGDKAYTANELLTDIRNDIFKETYKGQKLGYYRQLMQNVYVDWLLSGYHFKGLVDFDPKAVDTQTPNHLFENHQAFCNYDSFNMLASELSDEQQIEKLKEQYAIENGLHYQYMFNFRGNKEAKIKSLLLAEVKRVKSIIQKYKYVSDDETRAHYEYLLKKIDMYLE